MLMEMLEFYNDILECQPSPPPPLFACGCHRAPDRGFLSGLRVAAKFVTQPWPSRATHLPCLACT
jgi:hypothetical protein